MDWENVAKQIHVRDISPAELVFRHLCPICAPNPGIPCDHLYLDASSARDAAGEEIRAIRAIRGFLSFPTARSLLGEPMMTTGNYSGPKRPGRWD